MYAVLWWLMRTLFGHALLGIRANEDRMRAMGHDVLRLKLVAFVLAGALAGIAGHMAALTDAFVNPGTARLAPFGRGAADRAAGRHRRAARPDPRRVRLHADRRNRPAASPSASVWSKGSSSSPPCCCCAAASPGCGCAALRHDAVLQAIGLSRRFGGLLAVADVSLELAIGELHAVIGPNGAGKSTLVNLLAGELAPTAGTIRIDGRDVTGWSDWRIARCGVGRSFQRTNLMPEMTVLENARLAAQARARRHLWRRLRAMIRR